eukprot:TRINITY_DN17098_c0_g1_i1.p1 TRINITY_DN17098_c0_g1~~TRINITY_DN17098_c0_g1_i1.p1  ORF type:complete len:341 (-),score=61.22 TRINITY_DN17098_c0_g1_i1:10-1032(-)
MFEIKVFVICLFLLCACFCKVQKQDASSLKLVMYWGQDSAGNRYPNNLEKPLAQVCSYPGYDIINIGFVIIFFDQNNKGQLPGLNFANHCTTSFPGYPDLLNCTTDIGNDIKKCQSMGKKIVLSFGGAAGSYGFSSDSQAVSFAETVWKLFFEEKDAAFPRPFGDAIIDGVDLDIEGGMPTGYAAFVTALRSKMNSGSKTYYISGAPQCPFPDAYLGPKPGTPLGDAGRAFDYVTVQFYNNYCSYSGGSYFWSSFAQWASWSRTSTSSKVKIFLGLPASTGAAGGGYLSPDTLSGIVHSLHQNYTDVFGGVMLWDASWDQNNVVNGNPYGFSVVKILDSQ